MKTQSVKQCRRCMEEKPLSDFGKSRNRADGLSFWCRECTTGDRAEWSEEKREKRKQSQREYYRQHKAPLLAQNAKYRAEHREHLMTLDREKYAKIRIARMNAGLGRPVRKQTKGGLLECVQCHEMKPTSAFYHLSKYSSKFMSYCRLCIRGTNAHIYQEAKERELARGVAYRLLTKYGLTQDAFDAMLEHQQHSCLVCLREFRYTSQTDSPHVDHDHVTGKVRGFLCDGCNRGLGCARDNPLILRRMATYVEQGVAA